MRQYGSIYETTSIHRNPKVTATALTKDVYKLLDNKFPNFISLDLKNLPPEDKQWLETFCNEMIFSFTEIWEEVS